jgi:hypothetical protein
MIAENSGKIYRFKLDQNLGFGFAEIYDFTDDSMFDGRIVYVFNRSDKGEELNYELSEIRESGIALGPIRLHKFPNTRGLHSWKFILQTKDLLIHDLPETKELQGLHWLDNNWDNFKGKWYNSNYDKKGLPIYVDYDQLRHLETRIVNPPSGVVTKFTMKVILDKKEKVSDYYNLSELGTKNMFVQMVNTYFSLAKTKVFLKQLPAKDDRNVY